MNPYKLTPSQRSSEDHHLSRIVDGITGRTVRSVERVETIDGPAIKMDFGDGWVITVLKLHSWSSNFVGTVYR